MTSTKEGPITNKIVRELRALPNCYARKVHSGSYDSNGEPDIDACLNGRAIKIEVKAPGRLHKITPLQVAAINRWRAVGALAMVVTSWEEVETTLHSEGLLA